MDELRRDRPGQREWDASGAVTEVFWGHFWRPGHRDAMGYGTLSIQNMVRDDCLSHWHLGLNKFATLRGKLRPEEAFGIDDLSGRRREIGIYVFEFQGRGPCKTGE